MPQKTCINYMTGTRFSQTRFLVLSVDRQFITGAQLKAGTGLKMQSISVVFSMLHCEGYIADLRYRWLITSGSARWLTEILSAILKSTRHGGQSTERCIAFGGTTRSPAFTMHKLIYERKFKSEYLERQFYERLRESEPSIEKLIENIIERLIKVIYIE